MMIKFFEFFFYIFWFLVFRDIFGENLGRIKFNIGNLKDEFLWEFFRKELSYFWRKISFGRFVD